MKRTISLAMAAVLAGASFAMAGETPSAPGAAVYIVNLADGDTVSSPVKVVFGLSGMGVAPAGIVQDGTGHHHIFYNRAPFGDSDSDEIIPADDNHFHFGGGQTETELELEAGTHTLQLVLGDHDHIPHDPPVVSQVITITVE